MHRSLAQLGQELLEDRDCSIIIFISLGTNMVSGTKVIEEEEDLGSKPF